MKSFNFSHWDLSQKNRGLLFFAQCLEEMLFHYGHDSLKVPALNFRFLCIEMVKTIEEIESDTLDRGTLKPLFEELQDSFGKDPVAIALYGNDFPSLFYTKDVKGEYQRNCSDLLKEPSAEPTIKRIKKTLLYLINDMNIGDKYFSTLKTEIEKFVNSALFNYDEFNAIYQLSRVLLTDLINRSYSKEYIYSIVNGIFYNYQKRVDNTDVLGVFWNYFNFHEKEYTVQLPLKRRDLKSHLDNFKDVSIVQNNGGLFDSSCNWIIKTNVSAMDPDQARSTATILISFFVSLSQYNNHKSRPFSADRAIVTTVDTGEVYDSKAPIALLERGVNLDSKQNNEKMASMVDNFFPISELREKLINVVGLHSSAIGAIDISNQLLNLWTIIEILVPTEPKNSFSKINQICNILTTILNSGYVESLMKQLLADLRKCASETLISDISKIEEGVSDAEKMAALLVLTKHRDKKIELIDSLDQYPLLQYRMERYIKTLSNRAEVKDFLAAHKKRLSWQIMRIYRNRNMVVHVGSHFPYIDIIVQNLHHYVDSLIDTINIYAGQGYQSINTIYTAMQQNEYKHILLLELKEKDGTPKDIVNDFVAVVLGVR